MKRLIAGGLVLTLVTSMAFADTLKLPNELENISEKAFYGTESVEEVEIQLGTESIGSKAFANSSISRIYIPYSVTEIADDAFDGDTGLIIVSPEGVYAEAYAEEHDINWKSSDTDTIYFGHYDQDGNSSNGAERIEWRILEDYDNGTYLLLSEYGLDAKAYNNKETEVTWETCTLRSWLNGSFLSTAFTAEERKQLVTVTNQNPDNGKYGTEGGNATQDTVWLLSLDDVSKYFGVNATDYAQSDDLICYVTQTAKDNGAFKYKGGCWWWLRSPGRSSYSAAFVNHLGYVFADGLGVNYTPGCVRPVVLLRLS